MSFWRILMCMVVAAFGVICVYSIQISRHLPPPEYHLTDHEGNVVAMPKDGVVYFWRFSGDGVKYLAKFHNLADEYPEKQFLRVYIGNDRVKAQRMADFCGFSTVFTEDTFKSDIIIVKNGILKKILWPEEIDEIRKILQ